VIKDIENMARLTTTPAQLVTPPPPQIKTPATYTLELSAEELVALWTLCMKVGGSPNIPSFRCYVSNISAALPDFLQDNTRLFDGGKAWYSSVDTIAQNSLMAVPDGTRSPLWQGQVERAKRG